jgi:hypothetical protein
MANELSGEERLIARYFRPLAKHPAALELLDDAAALVLVPIGNPIRLVIRLESVDAHG